MSDKLKNIHVGALVQQRLSVCEMEMSRICTFFKCSEIEINLMLQSESMDSYLLLRWSKLLGYDFFRIYSQHLILYSPPFAAEKKNNDKKLPELPQFRKHMYTKEVIDFILELVESGKKTKNQIMEEYRIPRTTLYRWISKYNNQNDH